MTQQKAYGLGQVSQGLLAALLGDEVALKHAYDALVIARAKYEVASRRYAAMREAVRERLGVSPYSRKVRWPTDASSIESYTVLQQRGRFRYVHRKPGDAVVEALQESDTPLTLTELYSEMVGGGLGVSNIRAVNAALINMKGVEKLEGDKYRLEEKFKEELDPPF